MSGVDERPVNCDYEIIGVVKNQTELTDPDNQTQPPDKEEKRKKRAVKLRVEREQISSGKAKRKDSEKARRKQAAGPYPNEPQEKEKQSEGFVDAWLQVPAFQLWLQKAVDRRTGVFKAQCVLRVQKNEEVMRQRRQLESYFVSLLAIIAGKQLPISLIDTVVPLLRKVHPKDKRLKNVQLGRTKASTIIYDGFGSRLKKTLVEKLKEQWFSVIIDGTTDVTVDTACYRRSILGSS
ncbi:Transposon-derived Buster3 transposase-like protein [Daphnia sinensis]|uniref:Transposon-derived Buster3 transposase-like protein n=1 Tax=Daphnia sinensis TaxID=1820382 RepID=A0AAD5PX16_9CRUS|nr:Transposon-derived Buster3 transposase-like protein [Daphnia sinensis]